MKGNMPVYNHYRYVLPHFPKAVRCPGRPCRIFMVSYGCVHGFLFCWLPHFRFLLHAESGGVFTIPGSYARLRADSICCL